MRVEIPEFEAGRLRYRAPRMDDLDAFHAFRASDRAAGIGGPFPGRGDAFGKLAGRPAALFVSRGPGSSNAAIGVHTAMQDSTPMVVFVGHVNSHAMGRESFQEIDQHAFFGSVAKAVLSPFRRSPSSA